VGSIPAAPNEDDISGVYEWVDDEGTHMRVVVNGPLRRVSVFSEPVDVHRGLWRWVEIAPGESLEVLGLDINDRVKEISDDMDVERHIDQQPGPGCA
jgi:hypothetical protein